MEGLAPLFILDNPALDVVEADALQVVAGALEIPALLAVELEEGAGILHDLLVRFHLAQELRDLGLDAAVAGDVDLVSGIDADDADVLDAGFGAVARAARDGQLDLVRRVHVEQHLFQLDAHGHRQLRAEAAVLGADAGLHGTDRLAVGVAGNHAGGVEVGPHLRQVFLLHPKQVDALAAGHLDGRHVVLLGGVGDGAQFGRRRQPAPHARHDRIGAILLDVGVRTLVDEARLRIVLRVVRPGRDQVIVERGAALVAAVRRLPFEKGHDLRNARQVLLADHLAYLVMAVIGAGAHRLLVGSGRRVGAADGRGENLFDQAGAGTAGRCRLGVFLDLVEGEQAFFLDCLDNDALGNPVATADLGAVGHRRCLAVAGMADVTDQRLAEDQRIADVVDVAAVLEQLEIPRTVGRIAIHDAADQPVVLDDQLLVDAAGRVVEDDFLGILAAHVVTGRKQVDAGHLELGRGHRAGVATDAVAGQMVGRHLGLLEQRRDQAVGDAAVADALADRIDLGVVGLHRVIDHDAAVAVDAGRFGQRIVGTDAGGHDHQIGRNLHAVLETDGGNATALALNQHLGLLFQQELEALVLERLLQHPAGHFVELAFEQPRAEVHHGDIHAAQFEAVGRFEAEQTAADDHRVPVHAGGFDHLVGVLDVAVTDDTRQIVAGNRQNERVRAGGDEQAVVGFLGAVVGDHLAFDAVDLGDLLAGVELDALFLVPVELVEDDFLDGHFAGEHRREQDAVVVRVGFGAEDRDVVMIRLDLQQLFDGSYAGHAVADQDETGFAHF